MRSFDGTDADFFLELLPGPRDRNGLPESIRFWKHRIEETDADRTFDVGLIFGPSGCGKSSFVKAGLLPHLNHVISIYVEATSCETERRLLKSIQKYFPDLTSDAGLVEVIQSLRRRDPQQPKVLLVLDQFEQWLHAHREPHSGELVDALRQCDAGRVQCLLLIRDDFWMAINRFMAALEIPIESHNSAAVDRFDPLHAGKVLTALGRAFDRLPQDPAAAITGQQEKFIQQAVSELSQEGKVICLRLSLFADMMKGRPWTPVELQKVGGSQGLGEAFLEETFSATTAPPQHQLHQRAARAILSTLLPDAGTEIKGYMRSREELLAAAKYEHRPGEFDQLLTILDRDLRLITPIDLEAAADDEHGAILPAGQERQEAYYQLTHDYLVPSLRAWLTRKQKETRRGRAELQLADRAQLWNKKPTKRLLPGLWEFFQLRMLTDRTKWSEVQQDMMRAASRQQLIRITTAVALLALAMWGGWRITSRFQATSLVEQLKTAKPSEVLPIVEQLQSHLAAATPLLTQLIEQPADSPAQLQQQLHARIALVRTDRKQVVPLTESLLTSDPAYIHVIRQALRLHRQSLVAPLWEVLSAKSQPATRRFRMPWHWQITMRARIAGLTRQSDL